MSQELDTTSNNSEKSGNSNTGIAAYKTIVKVFVILAGLWGAMTTATYYIGYSFLQGRIEGLGLGTHVLKLSNHEMIRQATLAMFEIRQDLLKSISEMLQMGWLGYLLVGITGATIIAIYLPKKKKYDHKNKSKISQLFSTWPRWLRRVVGLPIISIITVIYFLIIVFSLVNTAWSSLEIAHSVGVIKGLHDVAKQPCKKFEPIKDAKEYVPGCTKYFDFEGKEYPGKIIFSNHEMTIITTDKASYFFDKNRKILSKSKKLK